RRGGPARHEAVSRARRMRPSRQHMEGHATAAGSSPSPCATRLAGPARILANGTPERAQGPGLTRDAQPYGDAMTSRRTRSGTVRRLLVGVTLVATTAALSACGGDDSDSADDGDTTVTTGAATESQSDTSAAAQAPLR